MVPPLRSSLVEKMKSMPTKFLCWLWWLPVKEPSSDDALHQLWWRFVCISARITMYIGVLPSVVKPCTLVILWCMTMISCYLIMWWLALMDYHNIIRICGFPFVEKSWSLHPLYNTHLLELYSSSIHCSIVPLGASQLVVIEKIGREERNRAKEEPGLSSPPNFVPLRSQLDLSNI
jgi:hypothetical protein